MQNTNSKKRNPDITDDVMKDCLGYLVDSKRRRMKSEQEAPTGKSANPIFWLQKYLQKPERVSKNMLRIERLIYSKKQQGLSQAQYEWLLKQYQRW